MNPCHIAICLLSLLGMSLPVHGVENATDRRGYYRDPALHGDTLVFVSEGDLWSVSTGGGYAQRLTSNAGAESLPSISPDGESIAFRAEIEGASEVYTMPIHGGLPQRRTWHGDARPVGWAPDGRLMVSTRRYSQLPDPQIVLLDARSTPELLPLAEAAEAVYSADGRSLFFTRWYRQPSATKRYKGGFAESIWRFDGKAEAVALTADWAGTSHNPLFWNGRVYFLSDRSGVMNVYSMDPNGGALRQESHQRGFDVESASLAGGRIAYSCGADIWLLDLATGRENPVPIVIVSDFDQLRDHWVKKPLDYLTTAHLAPDGSSVVLSARGALFTVPAKPGRIVKIAADSQVRYREGRFLPDGKHLIALSTKSGETEFWMFSARGGGAPEQWTDDATVLRWQGVPSPDGRWLAHTDKDQRLWLYDVQTRRQRQIAQSQMADFADLSWSGDSRWLAYVELATNGFAQIKVLDVTAGEPHFITSDRYNSVNPVWSPDGKWLRFLSDRSLKTTVESPWGPRQPDPHFDRSMKLYEIALIPGLRSPFLPPDELNPDKSDAADERGAEQAAKPGAVAARVQRSAAGKPTPVRIDFGDMAARLNEIPVPAGNYDGLQTTDKRLCWLTATDTAPRVSALQCVDVANRGDEPETLFDKVKSFEISLDAKKMLIHRADDFYIIDADSKAAALSDPKTLQKAALNLSHWTFFVNPRAEYREIFIDAWRLERDYFYDRHMHGVDWRAVRDRYLPLVDRLSDRQELNDLIAHMVAELSALHTFVRGGDARVASEQIEVGALGARLRRDTAAGGFVVDHVLRFDPDRPGEAPPLARPGSMVKEGEVLLAIDGERLAEVADERALLRGKAGTPVLLEVKSPAGVTREVLVTPVKAADEWQLRYAEWEYTRRLEVERQSGGRIGYVHLRAMGADDIGQWARDFYPVFDRQALIIDVRHNHGGNIDSWLLGKLLRQAWFYWQPRVGRPQWNMQYAFRGHIVVLCDQETASDGEAFAEGFRRFKLGKVLGTRTWGGEIWLSAGNFEQDNGIATAAEIGVFGPEKQWLIEGHGVDPDLIVDNLPHAAFSGVDAQLQAALDELEREIRDDPRPVPSAPPYPNKSYPYPP